ncbi:MAG TPA: T9SS type A sorting domain-containing protein [Flavobacteriales bacterium]|nr:T9SS type A sorting domain-containing protein [Flavobacteriales bacterium]
MRQFAALLLLLPIISTAQTLWPVSVGGSTIGGTSPFYNPQNLTISVGDQVRWTNTSGTHNVNGSLSLFPGNPEGFSSGNPQSGGWTFTRTFTIPGVYNFHCTQIGHSATQFGSITVVDPSSSVAEVGEGAADLKVYPSPASDRLFVELGVLNAQTVRIIDLNGAERLTSGAARGTLTLDVSALPSANYFVLVTDEKGSVIARPFAKQ